ncbi:TPA: Damage inducible protein [Escherichia coli]|nr:Damage inducible protein [Escherichia coli]HAH0070654.1 Damage inducible protein [Escherichia coli]
MSVRPHKAIIVLGALISLLELIRYLLQLMG